MPAGKSPKSRSRRGSRGWNCRAGAGRTWRDGVRRDRRLESRHIALAKGGPPLAFCGAPIACVGVGKLHPFRRAAEPVEIEEVVDARLRGEGAPAVAQQAVKRDIENVDDVGFLHALVHPLVKDHDADRAHVYVTGVSNGSEMTIRLALQTPDFARAYAAVVASVPAPENMAITPKGEPDTVDQLFDGLKMFESRTAASL